MGAKLSTKTIRLKKATKPVLYGSLIGFAAAAAGFFKLALTLEFGNGKLVILLISIFLMGAVLFTLLAIIRLTREHYIGLFISTRGINDISTGHTYGMVHWKDVMEIRVAEKLENPKLKYIVLCVSNPQDYIDREPVSLKKRSLILKFHQYGSPICFSNRALDCSFDALLSLLETYSLAYQAEQENTHVHNNSLYPPY